ncbi:MAG: hypothetical protein DDT31_01371 [Syntrophomonadaceae bacterium]|nr:hypothetical protein [Bacillota bacterium]
MRAKKGPGENMKSKFVFNPRIIRSPWADYYGAEVETALQAYPDNYLREIAAEGYNGIWLHIILRETVSSALFPGAKRVGAAVLNRLVARAGKFKVKVYLYLCEPRGLRSDSPFWKKHPELRGQPCEFRNIGRDSGEYFALCSSTPQVKEFLEESSFRLFKEVPGLGGVFLITASEHHTHCYSHFPVKSSGLNTEDWARESARRGFSCPRCVARKPTEVAAEIIKLVNRGVQSAAPDADVIAWSWSWSILEPDPQEELISLLPKDIILMSDWERGGQKKVCGRRYSLDEYSFSYIGPSPRFKKQLKVAQKRGMQVMAKIQIGTTHELASVPYLPLPFLLAPKMERLNKIGVDGYLGCWIFGGEVSPMSRLAGKMSRLPQIPTLQAIKEVAQEEFGQKSASRVVHAWRSFSTAWRRYPFSIPFLYYGPINYATAYPISLDVNKVPPIPSWLPLPRDHRGRLIVGDNMDTWLEPFGAGTVIEALQELLKEWEKGMIILGEALKKDEKSERLKEELNLAGHINLSVRSTINIIGFYLTLREFHENRKKKVKNQLLQQIGNILKEELEIVRQDRELVKFDKRLGYHPEAHTHLFTFQDLEYKISLLKRTLKRIIRGVK